MHLAGLQGFYVWRGLDGPVTAVLAVIRARQRVGGRPDWPMTTQSSSQQGAIGDVLARLCQGAGLMIS